MSKKVTFTHCKYGGGLVSVSSRLTETNLHFTDKAVGMGMLSPSKPEIPVADIVSVEVSGGDIRKSRVGKAILMGPLALLAKSSKPETLVVVHTKADGSAHFVIDNEPSVKVRAKVGVWCTRLGIRQGDTTAPTAPTAVSVADEMAKLAALFDSGALTADEFASAKARLLS